MKELDIEDIEKLDRTRVTIPKEVLIEAERIRKELSELVRNPEVLKHGEEFAKKLHHISPKELLREFTI